MGAPQPLEDHPQGRVLVGPPGNLDVAHQRAPGQLGQRVGRLIADTDDAGAHLGQAPGEHRHLAGVAGAEQDDVH